MRAATDTVLHVDANSFYASCEICYRPSLRGRPVIVGGDQEARHGIVLAASTEAKRFGVKTGHVLWKAKQLCPQAIFLKPDYAKYLMFSNRLRALLGEYSDRVEPFGLDEAWCALYGDTIEQGHLLAEEIRKRVIRELGITVSIGIADNKIMAKLGSDYQKPNATTRVAPQDYDAIVWPLPVHDLLYVGPATEAKLKRRGIYTIGELARCDPEHLRAMFGINGYMLWRFANGLDDTRVADAGAVSPIKSIGNSMTTARDLVCDNDVRLIAFVLSESVSERLRAQGFRASTIEVWMRDNDLRSMTRQRKLKEPTLITREIADAAMSIYRANYDVERDKPLRSFGVRGSGLVTVHSNQQLSMFEDDGRQRTELLEHAIDDIRRRYGHFSLQRGSLMLEPRLTGVSPKNDHIHTFPSTPYGAG